MRNYYLGNTDQNINNTYVVAPEQRTVDPNDPSLLLNTLTNTASNSLDRTLDNVTKLATTKEVQEFLKENGLDVYVSNMSRESVKIILAWIGVLTVGYQLKKVVRNKYVFTSLIAGMGYLYFKNANSIPQAPQVTQA
jgi:hypothetical protein